jgi:ABC-type transport system involved in multi-copper enzyme maturation permease subunit
MLKSFRRILAVGMLTAAEGLRQPAFFILLAAAAAMTAFSPRFAAFHLNESAKMVVDLGLSTAVGCSSLLALLTASTTVSDEIEGRTALTMLAKPLRREEFILGKFLGVACVTSAFCLLMVPVLLATLRSQQFDKTSDPHFADAVRGAVIVFLCLAGLGMGARLLYNRGPGGVSSFWAAYAVATVALILYLLPGAARWDFRIVLGLFFTALHGCVIAAFAVALATRFTLVQAAIGTAAFFLLGHASGVVLAPFRDAQQQLTTIGLAVRAILPDLDQFNITDALATAYIDKPTPIPLDVAGGSALYAGLYACALLALAAAMFANRELS